MMSRVARWISGQSVATPSSTTLTRYCRWSAPITVASTQISVIVPVTTRDVTSRACMSTTTSAVRPGSGASTRSNVARRGRPSRSAKLRQDLARDQLDLLGLVPVGDEDDPVDAGPDLGAELLDALVGAAAHGVLDRRLAPGRHVPLGLEPATHRRLGRLARAPDVDRELVGAGQGHRVAPGLAREPDDLFPRLPVALGRVEIGQPAVALRGDAPEHGVDVAADEDRRARPLEGSRHHDRLAQVELVGLQRDARLGPETREDLEVPLEEPAALLERHADGVELSRVPTRGGAHDQPALRDHVERAEGLGGHGGIAQRED